MTEITFSSWIFVRCIHSLHIQYVYTSNRRMHVDVGFVSEQWVLYRYAVLLTSETNRDQAKRGPQLSAQLSDFCLQR